MTKEQAQQIMVESKSLGVYDGPMPEDDSFLIKEAEKIRDQAKDAYKAGVRGEAVVTILRLSEVEVETPQEKNGDAIAAIAQATKELDDRPAQTPQEPTVEQVYESGTVGMGAVSPSLPAPPEVDYTPDIPSDFTEISTTDLRKYLSAFNAAAAYASWLLSIEENMEDYARRVGDNYFDEALLRTKDTGEKQLKDILMATVNADEKVKLWRTRELKHKTQARTLKRQLEYYERTCDRLSREWTIRSEDIKHTK
jgi:hypothetical protein